MDGQTQSISSQQLYQNLGTASAPILVDVRRQDAFGRTWPETWIENNPSLVQNGVFGFNPFHGGPGFASFPSGHVAAVCAVITVLWWAYPNLRPIYAACVAAVAIGLIGANYHFLSDIFGGIFVGVSVGYITIKILSGKLFSESRSFKTPRQSDDR